VGEEPLARTRFEVVDGAPLAAKAHSADLRSSGGCGCDAQLARATLAITGWVQKGVELDSQHQGAERRQAPRWREHGHAPQ
jgi:hypothetical protein